jgi:periplasmic protein TonB
MYTKNQDWKDVADGFRERSYTIAILMILIALFIAPKIEIKPFKHKIEAKLFRVEMPDTDEKPFEKPIVQHEPIVVIFEDDLTDDAEDIPIVKTILPTTLIHHIAEPVPQKYRFADILPVPVKRILPIYPDFLYRASVEGTVNLDVEVLKSGKVGRIDLLKSADSNLGGFDDAAIEAVKQWEFQPATTGGKAVTCWVTFPVSFELE